MPRFYCPTRLVTGELLELPANAVRHVQVLRLQPGNVITLFNDGPGAEGQTTATGEFRATVSQMGRSRVQVQVGAHLALTREPMRQIHLALGMPANERMDWLVEKATELGMASLQPLMTERSVLRLQGERAEKKQAHWQSVAIAACEQCGGNRVPRIHPVRLLGDWLKLQATQPQAQRLALLLSLRPDASALRAAVAQSNTLPINQPMPAIESVEPPITFLSGPEGGLSASEEAAALAGGFAPVTLGPRVLRADTAALAALAALLV